MLLEILLKHKEKYEKNMWTIKITFIYFQSTFCAYCIYVILFKIVYYILFHNEAIITVLW